jgi:hypothetical protein
MYYMMFKFLYTYFFFCGLFQLQSYLGPFTVFKNSIWCYSYKVTPLLN